MRCFCFLKNVIDQTSYETAYKRRYGFDFAGPLIPFGAHVEFLPKSKVDKARVHEFGSKMLQGIFVGYQQDSGGGWSKDLLLADWDQIETLNMLVKFRPNGSTTRRLMSSVSKASLFFLLLKELCGNLAPTDIATVLLVGKRRETFCETTMLRKNARTR